MKKIISLLLCMVMVFSFAVPSFAVTSDDQATSLKSGWGFVSSAPSYPSGYNSSWFYLILYHTYQIRQTLNSIDTDTGNIYSRLGLINDSVSDLLVNSNAIKLDVDSIQGYSQLINTTLNSVKVNSDSILSNVQSLVGYVDGVEGLITTTNSRLSSILDDTDMLQKVLADDEDLAFKESQKENQQYIQDTFFNPGSALSLDVSKLTDFTNQFTDFTESFNFIEEFGTSTSPLESISEGSDFSQWFTTETGQDMDPTFGGGSGGGGEDPDPEPEPIKNWLPLATTEPGGSEIYNGIGYLPGYRWSNSVQGLVANADTSVSGYIPVSQLDTIYFYEFDFSETHPALVLFVDSNGQFLSSYRVDSLPLDENGVRSFNPSAYVSKVSFFRFVFLTESVDVGIVTVNQYPIQTASTFSLCVQTVPYVNESEVVTSYYADRMNEYYNLLGGDE